MTIQSSMASSVEKQSPNGASQTTGTVPVAKLLGITRTGPIYLTRADLTLLSVPVYLAFVQELALRSMKPKARVVSTVARRVGGDDALSAWDRTCAVVGPQLANTSARFRRQFLSETLTYVRRQGNINGIEPILGAAINATWPLLDLPTTERVLHAFTRNAATSVFAKEHLIPIADPITKTVSVFVPGELADLELHLEEWRERREVHFGAEAPANKPRHAGTSIDERLGLGGDPWGGRGDPRGADGRGGSRYYDDDPYGYGATAQKAWDSARGRDRWLDHGDPRLEGKDDPNIDKKALDLLHELLGPGDLDAAAEAALGWAGRGLGLGRFGWDSKDDILRDGGPFGFGAMLMPGGQGAGGWRDAVDGAGRAIHGARQAVGEWIEKWGQDTQQTGCDIMAKGNDMLYSGSYVEGVGGFAVLGAGGVGYATGVVIEKVGTEIKPSPPPEPDPDPDPEKKGGETGLYPDPYGGGGDPTTIWDGEGGVGPTTIWDGDGGVSPTTIWDENGGGGNPATIWDENGGGVAPNAVQGITFSATVIAGPGLRASAIQVGPRTFA